MLERPTISMLVLTALVSAIYVPEMQLRSIWQDLGFVGLGSKS